MRQNYLSFPQRIKLHKWLKASWENILTSRVSQAHAAKTASEMLGFPVTTSNLQGAKRELGIKDRWPSAPQARRAARTEAAKPSSDATSVEFGKQLEELRGEVASLRKAVELIASELGVKA